MAEEISNEEEFDNEEDFSNHQKVENKYETEESKFIQGEIQLVTRKIEREKIKLRIADERLEAKKKLYNQLQGKPVQKTDEEKEREHQKKLQENREHKLETISKPKTVNKAEEFRLTQKRQFTKINLVIHHLCMITFMGYQMEETTIVHVMTFWNMLKFKKKDLVIGI